MILKSSLFAVCAITILCVSTSAQTATVTSFGAYQGDSYAGQILITEPIITRTTSASVLAL